MERNSDTALRSSSLKIGLIVDSPTVSRYVADLVDWSKTEPGIDISHLIIQGDPPNQSRSNEMRSSLGRFDLKRRLESCLWLLLTRFEGMRLSKSPYADHLEHRDISKDVPRHIRVVSQVSKNGSRIRISGPDIEAIRSENFDLLIRCGSGMLLGEILGAARHGVISFHHGDNRINRGGPAGFWEVYRKEPYTGFIIQRLTDELDGGEVLRRGRFPTQGFYLANQAYVYGRSNYYLMKLLSDLAAKDALPSGEKRLPYFNGLFRRPALGPMLNYAARSVWDILATRIKTRLLKREQRWGIAFIRKPWREVVMRKASRIENPPGRFLADPFVVTRDGKDYCFVEDFDYGTQRGCISVLELRDRDAVFLGKTIVEPFHMSFPYVFEFEGRLYMVPETIDSGSIRIYEEDEFPARWKLKMFAMEGVSAADSMIFEHGGLWWMFTNINPSKGGDYCSELCIFYAKQPITNEWKPHAKNPIYIDPERARNGGILGEGGCIYRVSQTQGFRQYGAESRVFRIVELTPETYREELECSIKPNFFPRLLGTHHLHSNGAVTVFDYVREERVS